MTTAKIRPEYVTCVRDGVTGESLCGRSLGLEFYFVDVLHARANEAAGGRLLFCEGCRKTSERKVQ